MAVVTVCKNLETKGANFWPLSCTEAKLFVVQRGESGGKMKLSAAGNFCTTNGELRAGAAGRSCGRELRAELWAGAEGGSWETAAPGGGEEKLAELR